MAEDDTRGAPVATEPKATGYSWYVLSVLVVVYILNFIDRQIISILAVDIKADLGLSEATWASSAARPSRSSTRCSAFRSAASPTIGTA